MTCSLLRRHLEALVDGELDPAAQIEFERHATLCPPCTEQIRFARALKKGVSTSSSGVKVPDAFRARLAETLRTAEGPRKSSAPRRQSPLGSITWRTSLPLSVAAGLLFVLVGDRLFQVGAGVNQASTIPIFEDVVRTHATRLRADVENPREVREVSDFFRGKVEFPVRPAQLGVPSARLVGARLSNVRAERAAALYYDVDGHRVTVVVFPRPASTLDLPVRQVGGRDVYVGNVSGYPVSALERDGVTYAFTGDVDPALLVRIASGAH